MYKDEITKIKRQIQKGRWWLDESISADSRKKAKINLDFANRELETASHAIANLTQKIDEEGEHNELYGMLSSSVGGSIELVGRGWLHLRLDSPLPSTKNNIGIKLVSNSLTNLLDFYSGHYGALPWYEPAFVVIIEYRSPGDGGSFDHDNKAFRAIPNALKGRVFGDDNQFELSHGMFTKYSEQEFYCDVFVIPMSDIAGFAAEYLNF